MDAAPLIPIPEAIPAPWPVFEILTIPLFMLHLLFINVVLGGALLAFFSKTPRESALTGVLMDKIPSTLALGVTFGVAPLLFLQVLYGHLIYTSSILMAVYWLLVIPLLIIAYYGTYVHCRARVAWLRRTAIGMAALIFLYIAFIYTNNMTLMLQPEKWSAYFTRRSGAILNLSDATLWPRYLHFVIASVAVAGLFSSLIWQIRKKKGKAGAEEHLRKGLKIFAIATCLQVVVGFWFLLALPRPFMLAFMGGRLSGTLLLALAILLTAGCLVFAFKGRVWPAVYHLLALTLVMFLTRLVLRDLYISRFFRVSDLTLKPQYGVMVLFVVILALGLAAVWYMVHAMVQTSERGQSR